MGFHGVPKPVVHDCGPRPECREYLAGAVIRCDECGATYEAELVIERGTAPYKQWRRVS